MAGLGGGGAGGDAGAVKAGDAFVKLGVKDTTAPDLKKAEERFKQFGEAARKAVGGRVNELGERAGKTGVAGLGLVGGIGVLAELGRNADAFLSPLRDTNRELSVLANRAEAALTGLDALSASFDDARETAERLGLSTRDLDDRQLRFLQNRQRELVAQVQDIAKRRSEISDLNKPSDLFALFAGGDEKLEAALAKALESSREVQQEIDKIRNRRFADRRDGRGDTLREGLFDVGREIGDVLSDQVAGMGALERKMFDVIRAAGELNEAEQEVLQTQLEQARAADQRVKQREVEKGFIEEMKNAVLAFETQGLSPEDQRLAGLVARGFSNEQIMALRAIQQRMAQKAGPGFSSAGGFGGDLDSRSLSIASSWQRDVKAAVELSNEILDGLRTDVQAIPDKLVMR